MRSLMITLAGFAILAKEGFTIEQPARPSPDGQYGHCWNYDAWMYDSDDTDCNNLWDAWDDYCWNEGYPKVCVDVEDQVDNDPDFFDFYQLTMKKKLSVGFITKEIKQMIKAEKIALLDAAQDPQEVDESFNYSGAIIGTSIAVLGAAAATFAVRRCNKKDNDFERQ